MGKDLNEGHEQQSDRDKSLLNSVTVEPVVMFSLFAFSIYESVRDDLYLSRGCTVNLKYNSTVCNNLTYQHDIEVEVQTFVAPFITIRQYIHAALAVIFSLFVGPWSDKYGRKVPLLLPVATCTLTAILYLVFSLWMVPVELLLFACIPASLGGGIGITLVAGHSYVSDITSKESRTFRISLIEAAATFGRTLGTLLSGFLLRSVGHPAVFTVSSASFVFALIYGLLFVEETITNTLDSEDCCISFFDCQHVKCIIQTPFKKREGYKRAQIIIVILSVTTCGFATAERHVLGENGFTLRSATTVSEGWGATIGQHGNFNDVLSGSSSIELFYTRNVLHWTTFQTIMYQTYTSFVATAGTTIANYTLNFRLDVNDAVVCVLGTISLFVYYLMFASSTKTWMLYAAGTCALIAAVPWVNGRSMLSKYVSPKEVGSILYSLAFCQSLNQLLQPLYVLLYRDTLDYLPEAAYYVATIFVSIAGLGFGFVYFLDLLPTDENQRIKQDEGVKIKRYSATPAKTNDSR